VLCCLSVAVKNFVDRFTVHGDVGNLLLPAQVQQLHVLLEAISVCFQSVLNHVERFRLEFLFQLVIELPLLVLFCEDNWSYLNFSKAIIRMSSSPSI
jgi:hypothetical protein